MQPTRNGLMFIVLFSFRDEIMNNSLSILFLDFLRNKKATVITAAFAQLLAPLYCFNPLFHTWDAIRKLAILIAININERLIVNSPRRAWRGTVVATAIGTTKVTRIRSHTG